ncbi:anthranilate synthase component I [Candidatus Roizmanbacteria bacterium CG07_land_8_20_14_0_80_34_15]|uniref:Anthranilate synthase component I n=1 Tax=Candidatus Roizmanbacteria bacterium CG07_land_8_20_14_0_80_34_15 TaxID=1974849 RepID=A0A2M6YV88_9BACT|nr:MAG: anthranilate synthase component I [Candidatus Roizmanbacteria bacterium CG07_land_8_20_14_0_80_34_15]
MKKLPKIIIDKKPKYIKFGEDINFFELFQKIESRFDTCFILESLGEEEKFSRYSLIGFQPSKIISARKNILTINNRKYNVANPYFALKEIMPNQVLAKNYAGGLVGYLSYEAVNYFEPSIDVKVHELFDQFMFGVYDDGIILDKHSHELFYFYYRVNRIEALKRIGRLKINKTNFKAKFIRDTFTKKEHHKIVEKVKDQILKGNTFQCEVGFKSEYKITGNPLGLYKNLREINPSPFMYYFKFKNKKIIGASPELLFSLRDGEMTTRPLAGTIKRGQEEFEDRQLARKLLNDPKEKAEHSMLVDMQRNDLGRVAQFGTVRIRDLMSIKKFSHVQHISSEITGFIQPKEDMFSGLVSNFPMGTVSGTPKVETMKIIDKNEPQARGPYGGGVGQFGFNGDCTFALTLRSMFIADEYGYTQTSGGIVYDSIPEKEYEEITRKLAAMKKALSI